MSAPLRLIAKSLLIALALGFGVAGEPKANAAETTIPRLIETPTLRHTHAGVNLPPISERIPLEPLVVNLKAKGRVSGRHGGDLDTLIGRAKDARLVNAWGYARLVGYDENLNLKPDILKSIDNVDDRIFTLHLRKGHKWSDGAPFTTEDFRYWWEDIANNDKLSPAGPPHFMTVDGKKPRFEVIDETTVRYTWDEPNALFLPELAQARPPFIYRPAHYLKQFHEKYGDPEEIAEMVAAKKVRYWASLHNERDDMYGATNWAEPSLQPWVVAQGSSKQRQIFIRNAYYHRIDENGRQLPYIDRIVLTVADGRLISAKTQAGESTLQARGLAFSDITVLKRGEEGGHYKTYLWPIAKGSHITLYPNFTTRDPVWRKLMRDTRFRHALSLGIDRRMINRVLYFGLALESNDTILPQSPLYKDHYRTAWAGFDPRKANALLDEIGLTRKRGDGIRLLPDGRPLEIIVETTGESAEEIDALGLVGETWREIGVKLFPKPSQREVLRERALSGGLVMSAWGGLDNGIPTADMPPNELAPTNSEQLSWALWGDYMESGGKTGEPIDYAPAKKLSDLYLSWLVSGSMEKRREIWTRMLEINADETLRIGLISSVKQPVVVSERLRNVPKEGIYGWDPGAQFGIHRMDEFWLGLPNQQTAEGN
ncbi:peptide/nickel transport system substrate-binding protein [Breoghania corrubedonensis]|uniref:Peptide/nickel transport system substrate-binding protein n=1 Tax=Breoghania corrubedonensis TaxID=665038 RepID=A0A2T5V1H7_9HYPH|nr:ABC transporter substrate-binding protein [Breoghania corrubedonensis]PTW57613.1 peptide/nickel transport system substrate-binding protein [Breoghania corrubedonensis]